MEKFFLGMFAGIAALVGAALAADHFGYCPCSSGVSPEEIAAGMKYYEKMKAEEAEAAKETTETEEGSSN
ncbi:MAG: hypothetical protein IKK38_07950 [Spirochaetaceae bacterium]|nr:hypothetical protein [Spirochaetaceae bacterium]